MKKEKPVITRGEKVVLSILDVILGILTIIISAVLFAVPKPLLFYLIFLPLGIAFILTPLWLKLLNLKIVSTDDAKKIRQANYGKRVIITRKYFWILPLLILILLVIVYKNDDSISKTLLIIFFIISTLIWIFSLIEKKSKKDVLYTAVPQENNDTKIVKVTVLNMQKCEDINALFKNKYIIYTLRVHYKNGTTQLVEVRTDEKAFAEYEPYINVYNDPQYSDVNECEINPVVVDIIDDDNE